MAVDEQGAIKVRARIHRPVAAVLGRAAPEEDVAFGVDCLQLKPQVERIPRPAGEEVANAERAHDHVHAHRLSGLDRAASAAQNAALPPPTTTRSQDCIPACSY